MSNYIDPTSLTLPRFGELYGDRSIFLSGKAAWSGTILTTQDVKVTLPPLGDGALAVCLLPNAGYSLPSDGYTLYVKLNRASGNHSLVFNTDFFIYNATSIPHPSKDLIAVFTRQDGFIYTHSGEQVFTYTGTPIILGTLGASTISDYNFIVGPSFDNPKVTHTSIAQAISDAADGFSILILQGTYTVAAASNGAVDGAAGFAWTGKNISLTGASFDTVIQNTGSLTRAFGIQNASGSTINSILLVDFPQAVRFDNSSKCVVDVWQTNATFTDPASINTAENNQVTINVSSAALTPANQIRRYIVGTDSYYVDQSGSVLFTGSNFRVNGSAIFNSLTASQAVVTDASKQLVSLQYTSANLANTLVFRDGSGNFSAGTISASSFSGGSGAFTTLSANSTVTFSGLSSSNPGNVVTIDGSNNLHYTDQSNLIINRATHADRLYLNSSTSDYMHMDVGAFGGPTGDPTSDSFRLSKNGDPYRPVWNAALLDRSPGVPAVGGIAFNWTGAAPRDHDYASVMVGWNGASWTASDVPLYSSGDIRADGRFKGSASNNGVKLNINSGSQLTFDFTPNSGPADLAAVVCGFPGTPPSGIFRQYSSGLFDNTCGSLIPNFVPNFIYEYGQRITFILDGGTTTWSITSWSGTGGGPAITVP